MKTMTLKLRPSLDRALAARAKRQNRPKSALVRQALEDFLSNQSKAGSATFSELAGDLAGLVAGPRDLSRHPRHMKGFGL
jgi:predicted transcriptional regulator